MIIVIAIIIIITHTYTHKDTGFFSPSDIIIIVNLKLWPCWTFPLRTENLLYTVQMYCVFVCVRAVCVWCLYILVSIFFLLPV